ncbi:MAG TPA: Crp/Fnr family transcriptional regulator [Bacteroidales bacterium]|nr:Crp/Fnr family transcriptional regulator [Bacteroidales bacterium]
MKDFDPECLCATCEFREIAFSYLDDEMIKELCRHKKERTYRKGEIIHHGGDCITEFKYLKSGLVKLFRSTKNGDEQIITITKPFEFVSNMSIFSEQRYPYSVAALEDSAVCCIDLEYIKKLVLENGGFAIGLLTKISKANEKIISLTLDLRQKNLAGRVAYVLLYLSMEIYNSNIFDIPVSRREIADFIGMSMANVIRTLSDFKKEGILTFHGKTLVITDRKKLELISLMG